MRYVRYSFKDHEGWLWKWTNYVSGYQKRWFALSGDVLSYYISPKETTAGCRGNVILSSAKWIPENSCSFRIEVDGAFTYYLRASSSDDCERWMRALDENKQIAQSNHDNSSKLAHRRQISNGLKDVLLPIETKLAELRTCQNVNDKHCSAILNALAETNETHDLLPEDAKGDTRYKELSESVMLFRLTSSAMVNTCSEFLQLVAKQTYDWQNALEWHQMKHDDGSLFNTEGDSDVVEDEYHDAKDVPLTFANAMLDRSSRSSSRSTMSSEYQRSNHSILSQSTHRQRIPFKPSYRLDLWSILRHCIGRDISKLPVPVNFSEPISILQKLTEELEYSELLDKAALCSDRCMQLAYVAAFSVSAYSTTAFRTGKPFNPMLGETYEFDFIDELGFRYIAEQVSHHPPMAATYAESSKENGHGGWAYWQEIMPSSKFRGNYLTLAPIGTCHVLFHDSGHHYTWKKVLLTVNNIILGKLWIDQSGLSKIVNHTTGDSCDLKFYQYNYFDSESFRKVSGTVVDKNDIEHYLISGTWDKELTCKSLHTSLTQHDKVTTFTLWKVNPQPDHAERMYNFTSFAMVLNEWVEDCAPTDSRRRPDQRKMEETLWDEANQIKLELEERQRQRRKKLDEENAQRKKQRLLPKIHEPLWFRKQKCPVTGEKAYVFCHEYWDAKKRQDWAKCCDIFDIAGEKMSSSAKDTWPVLVKSWRTDKPGSSKEGEVESAGYVPPLQQKSNK